MVTRSFTGNPCFYSTTYIVLLSNRLKLFNSEPVILETFMPLSLANTFVC
jgi:hypothetical protein